MGARRRRHRHRRHAGQNPEPSRQGVDQLERALHALVRDGVRRTGCRTLSYAGGVAMNSKANGRLLESGIIDEIYVQPAATDDGAAIGAAIAAHEVVGAPIPRYRMTDSVVWLAAKSQRPIVPVSLNSRWHRELNGWDRMQIPKPFSPAELVMGEPLRVPTDLARGDRGGWAATV
ncbi:MAG: hypothetical protein IID05_13920, partial [Gemmatimonadetes bacterium]|nr:hypothetical protein [Gemmatimonadota bacterium]